MLKGVYDNHNIVQNKVAPRCLSVCMLRSLKHPTDFDAVFLIDSNILSSNIALNTLV
jgi:hypothetical protein